MAQEHGTLQALLDDTFKVLARVTDAYRPSLHLQEIGTVHSIGHGIARVHGLPTVRAEELVRFPGGFLGMVFNVDAHEVGVMLLDADAQLYAGAEVRRTGGVVDVPVGETLLGRIVDAMGRPLDTKGPLRTVERRAVEQDAPAIMERAPVTVPLHTGLKVVDALIPIGRGQRELILGDRQTGKTAIALDTIINQRDKDVLCVYCAIGKRGAAVARVIADLRQHQALDYCLVVATTEGDPPGLQYIAPYAATTMAEYFMHQGRDVLVVFDDLTRHARAYREVSLLLRRPPGREAYPGDIFYVHARLLERSTHVRPEYGGGSLTALPIVETEAQNMSAYIPTNLISITDGQIYLSPELFQKGILPAVDVGKSVSRVGGKTQLAAYRAVAGDLRLSYAQFEELEAFARFGTRLDAGTRQSLERGRRVREVLKQPQYEPLPSAEQIAVLLALNAGVFDPLAPSEIADAEQVIRQAVSKALPEVCARLQAGARLLDDDRLALLEVAREACPESKGKGIMHTLEVLQRHIASAEDLQSVVKTMKALAAVNIRQYETAVESLAAYHRTIELGLHVVLTARGERTMSREPVPDHRLGALVFGSDQGMCGQLNEQIVNHACQAMTELGGRPEVSRIAVLGARVADRLAEVGQPVETCFAVPNSLAGVTPLVQDMVLHIEAWHTQQHLERIYLFYSQHLAGAAYRPRTVHLLPVSQLWLRTVEMEAWPNHVLPTFTMDWQRLFAALMQQYLFVSLYRACAESLASENASRLAAMQGAERNIDDRLSELQEEFRQQRQLAITAELLDIVAGFEALTQEPL